MAGQRLDATQAARFLQAQRLLQAGQPAEALSIAAALSSEVPRAADAWQLLGMCLAANDRPGEADSAFQRALALLPDNPVLARNYGVFLARYGRTLRVQGELESAEQVLRRALALREAPLSVWIDLGTVLRSLGRIDEALEAYRHAEQLTAQRGEPLPEVQDAINGVLADAGRTAEALAGARKLVAAHPAHAAGHETLSHLLWENGAELAPGEDPLAEFRTAAAAQLGNRALQLAFTRMLLATRRPEEALAVLKPLRHRDPDDPVLAWFAADAQDALRHHAEAAALYAAASRTSLGALPAFLNARARHAFRCGDVELAQRCAGQAVAQAPDDQEAWSLLGLAWRLTANEKEHWLCDYETLVGYMAIDPPPGFGDLEDFLQELAEALHPMHNASREPVSQSVRGGTQTAGRLFGRDVAVIGAAESALRAAVERWLSVLPDDPSHPFLSRKQGGVRFVGSWSVRLNASGHHSNHIHSSGWASSAFYVALPRHVFAGDDPGHAGWIQFGQPLEDLGLDLPPRRVIRPRPGHLALFPSYLWHGTVPFEDTEPRLTIAFDMQPSTRRGTAGGV